MSCCGSWDVLQSAVHSIFLIDAGGLSCEPFPADSHEVRMYVCEKIYPQGAVPLPPEIRSSGIAWPDDHAIRMQCLCLILGNRSVIEITEVRDSNPPTDAICVWETVVEVDFASYGTRAELIVSSRLLRNR